MKTIQSKQKVGPDGQIRLEIPIGRAGEEVEVLVVVSELAGEPPVSSPDLEWAEATQRAWGSCPDLEAPDDPPPAPLKETL